jgi:hypothetical protein
MDKWYVCLSVFVLFTGLSRAQVTSFDTIYTSRDLSGHLVTAECNPGGTTSCPCSDEDVSIESFGTYGTVTSNVRRVHTYVNAIGYKKFQEIFPQGDSISLGVYKYVGYVRLPKIPAPDVNQEENPEAVHFMIQAWDGRGSLFNGSDSSYEGTIYWELNPWIQPTGKIKIYTEPTDSTGTLTEIGLTLSPDTLWHRFEIVIDLETRRYVSVSVDDSTRSLDCQLHRVYHPDWGEDISLNITTESLPAWPQADCGHVFTWTTWFRDLALYRESAATEVSDNTWIPWTATLLQNYPNPFNPSTTIRYELPRNVFVTLIVYDMLGRQVETLVNERQSAGSHSVSFSARNVPSGVYFYRLEAGTYHDTKKLLIVK